MNQSSIIAQCDVLDDRSNIYWFILVTVLSFCFLIIHYTYFENKIIINRNWSVWLMDNSKQFFSSFISIFCVLICKNKTMITDHCAWFFYLFSVDTILGVILTLGLCRTTLFCFHKCNDRMATKWLTIGNYLTQGYAYKWHIWCIQNLHWNICYLLARGQCSLIIFYTTNKWPEIIGWLSGLWGNYRELELYFVLVILPLFLYTAQYLIQNTYLRRKSPQKPNILDTRRQPLIYNIV
jgi:hypothetical protein